VSRGIALLFLEPRHSRCGWGGQSHASAASTPVKDPVPIVQEAKFAPGPVWTGVGNLAPTVIRSPNRPARIQPLYRYATLPTYSNCILINNSKAQLHYSSQLGKGVFVVCARDDILPDVLCLKLATYFGKVLYAILNFILTSRI